MKNSRIWYDKFGDECRSHEQFTWTRFHLSPGTMGNLWRTITHYTPHIPLAFPIVSLWMLKKASFYFAILFTCEQADLMWGMKIERRLISYQLIREASSAKRVGGSRFVRICVRDVKWLAERNGKQKATGWQFYSLCFICCTNVLHLCLSDGLPSVRNFRKMDGRDSWVD